MTDEEARGEALTRAHATTKGLLMHHASGRWETVAEVRDAQIEEVRSLLGSLLPKTADEDKQAQVSMAEAFSAADDLNAVRNVLEAAAGKLGVEALERVLARAEARAASTAIGPAIAARLAEQAQLERIRVWYLGEAGRSVTLEPESCSLCWVSRAPGHEDFLTLEQAAKWIEEHP